MFCSKCGKQINDDALFCEFCGNKTNVSTAVVVNEDNNNTISTLNSNSKYSKDEQTNIVGIAAELEATIIAEKNEIPKIRNEVFPKLMPKEPSFIDVEEPQYVSPEVPGITVQEFYEWASKNSGINNFVFKMKTLSLVVMILLMLLGAIFVFVLGIVSTFSEFNPVLLILAVVFAGLSVYIFILRLKKNKQYDKYKAETLEAGENSSEYQEAYAIAVKEADDKNAVLKAEYETKLKAVQDEYEAAKSNYKNVLIPEYNREKAEWQKKQEYKISFLKDDLSKNIDALSTLYSNTKLIPNTYRSIDKLVWIYEDMSTSEHDIERAIDLLNHKELKEELQQIQSQISDLQDTMVTGFVGIYSAIQEGNQIQSEMLSNLESIRKSVKANNYMNVGMLIQNHKRNKMLSQIHDDISG